MGRDVDQVGLLCVMLVTCEQVCVSCLVLGIDMTHIGVCYWKNA